jgi:hypothetical protein
MRAMGRFIVWKQEHHDLVPCANWVRRPLGIDTAAEIRAFAPSAGLMLLTQHMEIHHGCA